MHSDNPVFAFRPPIALALRLLLATLPALIGNLTWEWLETATGSKYPYGFHPLWIYFWHPPLMDFLFGIVVLGSFVEIRRRWWFYAAFLGLASFLVHAIAVMAVANSQWLLAPFIDLRFISVLPVAAVATIALTSATATFAGLAPGRLLLPSILAGLITGMIFLLALELDTTGQSWFWRNNIQWMLWHASMAAAIHFGVESRRM